MIQKFLLIAALTYLTACSMQGKHDQAGYLTEVRDGRLWVFKPDSKELAEFQKTGETVKQFTAIGAGPEGMTVRAGDQKTLDGYIAALKK